MSAPQLTTDGLEIETAEVMARLNQTPRRRELIRALVRAGADGMRTTEAGRIVHGQRGHCGHRKRFPANSDMHIRCCTYAAADGWSAMNALSKLGIAERVGRGRWVLRDS